MFPHSRLTRLLLFVFFLLGLPHTAHAVAILGRMQIGDACANGDTGFSDSYSKVLICSGGVWTDGGFTPSSTASMTAASAAITTSETPILSMAIPANTLGAGISFKIRLFGAATSGIATTSNLRVRLGTANSNSDPVVAAITPTSALGGSNVPFGAEFLITVRTGGASGTMAGMGQLVNNGALGITATGSVIGANTTSTVNTAVANYIRITFQSGNAATSATFQLANIQINKP